MRFELCPSFFNGMILVPPATCAHEVACCKYFCVPNVDLLRVTSFRLVLLIMTLLKLWDSGSNLDLS
jgi:hypothetical protein